MKALLTTTLLLILAQPLSASMTVTIQIYYEAYCTDSTGQLDAYVYGGVPPYTYVWNTGDTTEYLSGVPAGIYTVMVTDAVGNVGTDEQELVQQDLTQGFWASGTAWMMGWCEASGPIMYWAPDLAIFGPPPYYMNGEELFPSEFYDYIYFIPIPGEAGDSIAIPFENASGCTGIFNWVIPPATQWPSVSVDQVNGACGGNSNGSILVTFTGGNQLSGYDLQDADSNLVVPTTFSNTPFTTQFTGLAPGTYSLYLRNYYPGYGYPELCDTVINILVPDLGAVCGQVNGTVYMDLDEDCTLGAEPHVPNLLLSVQPGDQYSFTDTAGTYALNLDPGNYTVQHGSTIIEEHCFGVPIPFTIDTSLAPVTVDLANISSVGMDARMDLHGSAARPGFPFNLWGTVQSLTPGNTGGLTVTMQFDPLLTLTSTGPTASSITGNTITWDLAALPYFGQIGFSAQFMVPADADLLGTTLTNSAEVSTGLPDSDMANNSSTALVTITGSYDPNDKRGLTNVGKSDDQFLLGQDAYIDYTIRFQNTGTDTAFTVVIYDDIGPSFDLLSLDILAASHAFIPSFGEGRQLEFTFPNILLPDSTTDFIGSQGFISYRIKPKSTIAAGDVLENTADIYFDFNEPVVTNTTSHVVETATGVQEREVGQVLRLMPNPTSGMLEVRVPDHSASFGRLQVVAVDGRVVLERRMEGPRTVLDVAPLARGLYALNWYNANGAVTTKRFVRK